MDAQRGHRYPRSARLNETLREVIAEELVRIDDERLAFVTITKIDVDNELNRAIVYFDSLEGEDGDEPILDVLEEHRRRIQSSINRQMRTKKTPVLGVPARRRHPRPPSASRTSCGPTAPVAPATTT